MKKKYIFKGQSDNIFGEYGITDIQYLERFTGRVRPLSHFTLKRPNGEGLLITGQYTVGGTWHIGVSVLNKKQPPNKDEWQFYFEPDEDVTYNNRLIVIAPEDTKLQIITDDE